MIGFGSWKASCAKQPPATKADIDELHERLGKIEAMLETMCKDLHLGQRGWRFRRGNEHHSRRAA